MMIDESKGEGERLSEKDERIEKGTGKMEEEETRGNSDEDGLAREER